MISYDLMFEMIYQDQMCGCFLFSFFKRNFGRHVGGG
jgi:hypothetical protein